MAHPPNASAAAAKSDHPDDEHSFGGPDSEVTLARDVLRADGLNAVERSEREAAEDENRAEEAAIFERAASRLRPSWSEADQMLELGLANAVPELPVVVNAPAPQPVVQQPSVPQPSFAQPTFAPASFPAVVPSASSSANEVTDGFPAVGLKRPLDRRTMLIAGAVGCILLGGLWAGLSDSEPAARAPAAVAAPAAAPVSQPAPAPASPAPVMNAAPASAPAVPAKRELSREEVNALLGLPPPKPAAKAPVKKPIAKAKAPVKAPLKKAPLKKPAPKR